MEHCQSADVRVNSGAGALPCPDGDLWVYGYGSLMWDPGFAHAESLPARIYGYHRALCIRSTRYRGTDAVPGLVFGLDCGGSCVGMGFRVPDRHRTEALEYLESREMPHRVYNPCIKSIVLQDGRTVDALTFVVKRQHPRYIRNLTPIQTATIISSASGERGPNLEYVRASVEKLATIGIRDPSLSRICELALGTAKRIGDPCQPT